MESEIDKEEHEVVDVRSDLLDEYIESCVFYRCKACGETSTDKKPFYQHCLTHYIQEKSAVTVYLCSVCNSSFDSLVATRKHMKEEHSGCNTVVLSPTNEKVVADRQISDTDAASLFCSVCERSFDNLAEMRDHTECCAAAASPTVDNDLEKQTSTDTQKKNSYKKREKDKFWCCLRGCKASFKKAEELAMHNNCHMTGNEKLFRCPECNITVPSWPRCAEHLYKVHLIDCGLLKCPVCESYRTWMPLTLENHMRVHSDFRAFVCKICGNGFKQSSQLRNHCATHQDPASNNRSKCKQCSMCFKFYSDAKALKKHKEEVHNRIRPFVCNVCGHATARRSLLAVHQRQHTGVKTHHCQICRYTTADHNSLRLHMMRHTGVRMYHCPECTYSSIKSSGFKLHMKNKHPDSTHSATFACVKCFYKTVSEDQYMRHVSDHLTGLLKSSDGDGGAGDRLKLAALSLNFPAWVPVPADEVPSPKIQLEEQQPS